MSGSKKRSQKQASNEHECDMKHGIDHFAFWLLQRPSHYENSMQQSNMSVYIQQTAYIRNLLLHLSVPVAGSMAKTLSFSHSY